MITALLQDRAMLTVATVQVPDQGGGPHVIIWSDRAFLRIGFVNDKLVYAERTAWWARDPTPAAADAAGG